MTTSSSTRSHSAGGAALKPKHVPQRTCVGCRSSSAKREFVRVVRAPGASVAVDPTGRANGRGAYVCARAECWDVALNKDRLARALRTTMTEADRAALRRYAEQFAPATIGG